jgi:hypothetical protein
VPVATSAIRGEGIVERCFEMEAGRRVSVMRRKRLCWKSRREDSRPEVPLFKV